MLWAQKKGRDWTIAAFLQNRDGGLGIEVAADTVTKVDTNSGRLVSSWCQTVGKRKEADAVMLSAPLFTPFVWAAGLGFEPS